MNALALERPHFDTRVTNDSITALSRYLGADPREFIPCKPGTKEPKPRGFNLPHYGTNWDRWLRGGQQELNVALLFGEL